VQETADLKKKTSWNHYAKQRDSHVVL